MIRLIYGKKGSGKSKKLIDMANAEVDNATGDIVYIDDDNRCMFDLKHEIRFVNSAEYGIDSADKLYGFICGILSANFDISSIYIDGLKKITKMEDEDLSRLLDSLDKRLTDVKAFMVVSGGEKTPDFFGKYID